MPLRATLNNKDIYAFHYDELAWHALKIEHVLMHCCDNKAVLKKSKLGTLFFAHSKKGECTSLPESPEHIYLGQQGRTTGSYMVRPTMQGKVAG